MNQTTQVTEAEAELVHRQATRLSHAAAELSRPPSRPFALYLALVPVLFMTAFGQAFSNALGVSTPVAWLFAGAFTGFYVCSLEFILLKRRVAALTEVVRSMQKTDA